MSSADELDPDSQRRTYQGPHSARHPIPTIQKYKAERQELNNNQQDAEQAQRDETDDSTYKRAYHAAKGVLKGEDPPQSGHDPYRTQNRNVHTEGEERAAGGRERQQDGPEEGQNREEPQTNGEQKTDEPGQSATEAVAGQHDPRQKRKDMKHKKRSDGGREVTDPVTHLPIVIRDSTHKDLKSAGENIPGPGVDYRTRTGVDGATKSKEEHDTERRELQSSLDGMQKLFPPPKFEDVRDELARTYERAAMIGLSCIAVVILLGQLLALVFDVGFYKKDAGWVSKVCALAFVLVPAVVAGSVIVGVKGWLGKKVQTIWDDEVWDAARQEELSTTQAEDVVPESVAWLNNLLSAVWPLINPDLFTSISDMLEDVMQASLPKVVRMVSVDDLGQGSEAFRILGINWLPTGAASQSVGSDGGLKRPGKDEENDRTAAGQGQVDNGADDQGGGEAKSGDNTQDKQQKEQEDQAIREGMEAEQGDFVNMELAFAYRARSSGKSLTAKAKNAHLYLKFYLPGGIAVPVWVELRGIIGTMRLRLQLTPDPPFFSLCTLTFMGQPQADMSCVPLSKHALNLMDVPLISSFVQSSIDAALAEYVAPKSLTLDLKDMLVGDDFKKDTVTRGVVMIFIKSAQGFKQGDGGVGPFQGSSDAYMTVSWGKFGKPVSSTRIIVDDQEPNWSEWSHILVTPEELNADEKLRLQLWDSDKWTADDDLGRVEVDLKELMFGSKTKNKMCDREDRFKGEDSDEDMPGTLQWQVGYFEKTQITEQQLAKQNADPNIRTVDDLRKQVSDTAERKLREATAHDESREIKQQKQEDYKEQEDALVISSPPPDEYPSGIFSIQIHNITGLEVQSLQKKDKNNANDNREDEAEQSDDMPSSYATIILNHQKIYRTRTKPKNAKPFFNAGTERFVADWKTAEVMVAVLDDREREDDAQLGMIYLPLRRVFQENSQVTQTYPLVGGIGYGRARISMVWRSVELKLPKELLGWSYGTLEIRCPVRSKDARVHTNEEKSYSQHRIKLRTNMMRAKMWPGSGDDVEWKPKGDKKSVFLAVRKRYSSPLIIEFRKSSLGPDSTPAFGVFWLKDIPDEEEKAITVKVWKGGKEAAHRATTSYGYSGMEENEQPLGEIELTIKFWRGLSGYHKSFADKSRNADMRHVMEVLDTANDEGQVEEFEGEYGGESQASEDEDSENTDNEHGSEPSKKNDRSRRKLRTHTNDDSSASDSDAGSTNSKNPIRAPAQMISKPLSTASHLAGKVLDVNGHNDPDDGDRGLRAQVRDYKDHHKQLHRKHRGVMQWRGARTVDWMAKKVKGIEGLGDRVVSRDKDGDKSGGGVETEV
ncbi:C2 (Calcium/lipid-binding, CaLB) [Cladophialophora carrionii]|uniref:C2 (Calcium/lipid-binding, CaLB) n=1 Tax=Cladophialophora carrionii TaxID=86049 RepID=A0A1C1D1L5_9EURO|nr:C2 (Calcium/lipid-binding, CaLB) [Cladophialophora carrionii]